MTASSTNTALIPNPAVTYASPNATGSLTFTPVAGQSGTATVAVTVTDGLSATVRTFRVTVYAPPSLFAYVAADEAGLLIVDVSVPTKPRLASTYDTPGFARSVALSGTLAYIADWHRGLRIADVSDPTAPQHAGGYDTQGYATDVAVFGHYAYVADMEYGLQILDVAYPAAPQVVGHYQPSGIYIMGVTVAASNPPGHVYAYVTTSVQGLRIVDVTDPANPQWVGSASTGWSWDVEVHDGYAYVTGGSNGLRLVDVSDPANPQIVARADTPGMARGFDVAGSYAYVADESTGLQVIDLNPPPAPQATACDRYGQCTTVTATQVQATDAPARITQADGPAVDFLGAPIVLDSTAPTSVTVSTASPASLRALTVTLDAAPFHAETWASATVTEAVRTLDWTPSTEGAHVFSATVADWSRWRRQHHHHHYRGHITTDARHHADGAHRHALPRAAHSRPDRLGQRYRRRGQRHRTVWRCGLRRGHRRRHVARARLSGPGRAARWDAHRRHRSRGRRRRARNVDHRDRRG